MSHSCIPECTNPDGNPFQHALGCPNAPNGRDCEHGRLKRQCPECEKDREITKLKKRIKEFEEVTQITINTLGDVKRGFANYVDPARWVAQVQEPLRILLDKNSQNPT